LAEPNALATRPAFRIELDFDRTLRIGTLAGKRGFFRIAKGVVSGERLNGEVVDDGGDWIAFRPDGVVETDSRLVIRAADGTLIYLRSRGVLRVRPGQLAEYEANGALDGGDGYYRTAPWFDTPVGPHDWLTKTLFVGTGRFSGSRSVIDIHEVL